jgi:Ran GTPase-activating protein (RanGAP) involved in mRNA processing and transport
MDILTSVQTSKVQRIDLSYNSVSPSHIRDCLQKLVLGRLKSLNLSGWLFADSHCPQLLALIAGNASLEDFHLAKVPLSPASLDSVVGRLRSLSTLVSVDFSGCKVKVEAVGRLMQGCHSLRQVILKDLVFSPQDYNALVKAIEQATHLEVCLIDSK